MTGRPLRLRDLDLDAFLHPRSIAVVGAGDQPGRGNTHFTGMLKAFADRTGAAFHPVHPTYDTVFGAPCYRSMAEVPEVVDLAAILTSGAVEAFEDIRAAGAKFAVVFAAGFAETGPDGQRRQARLAALVEQGPTHLLGPNTNLNGFSEFRTDLPGPSIALITQSGHQGRPVFQGQELGIAVSHWAPTGNEVELEFADFARHFADLPEVGVIASYIEGFKDGRTLTLAADHAARVRTPIVMVKVGRTEAGRSMAKAHTGHLAGSDAVTDAVFRQFGVTRVDGLDELLEVSAMFARTRPPGGDGIAVYSISGGTSAHLADLIGAAGLRLPRLTTTTQEALHDGLIETFLQVSNPVDCGATPVMDARGRKIIETILADPGVDVLVVPITGAVDMFSDPMTRDLVEVAKTSDKPIFTVWGAPPGTDDTYYLRMLEGGLPTFRTFGNCVTALRAYLDYWGFVRRYRSPFADAPTAPLPAAAEARRAISHLGHGSTASEHASKAVLRAYGICTSRDTLCTSAADAVRAAQALGYPVVMKPSAGALSHKSDLGLVRVGVASDAEVREAYADLERRARGAVGCDDGLDGILVCEQVDGGVEMVIGVSRDELFGPVVMVGLGGVLVEVLGDVTFRVPPFDADEARRMLRELKGYRLLEGARGAAPADIDALVDAIVRVGRLAQDLADEVAEIDINPLVVRPRGAVALDALVVRR
ncbi:MAG TPA: acetate--CoA ligase family protein [Acidimicrobiales bacterium]|nr:acetate--CoA ligase family protein [Acidimicrobiales bacterium]